MPRIVYLEGYLWDPEEPRAAMRKAIRTAREAGTKVAFTLSDGFVVDRHRADIEALIGEGAIDILFANEAEAIALTGAGGLRCRRSRLIAGRVPHRGRHPRRAGRDRDPRRASRACRRRADRALVDTTGAGDLFAAGFLAGEARGLGLDAALRLGAIAAAEVIQHYGARPEADLKELASELLG